jgi:hypothetical protein
VERIESVPRFPISHSFDARTVDQLTTSTAVISYIFTTRLTPGIVLTKFEQSSQQIMFRSSLLRQVSRASTTTAPRVSSTAFITRQTTRGLRISSTRFDKINDNDDNDRHDALTTAGEPGAFEHEGQHSRTDKTIRIEHPEESQLPSSMPVKGRGGSHYKRTLATFSLEGRVGVVTGGARGLGLVMAQALVVSGADVALVDMNSKMRNRHHTDQHKDGEG